MVREDEIKKAFFLLLKDGIDRIAPKYEGCRVDIEAIARNCGITDIIRTPSENILGKYALLTGTKMYIDKDGSAGKQRFAVAHEIFHFLTNWPASDSMQAVAREGEAWKKQNAGSIEAAVETIADYFAANLLVPTERFILHSDKTDEEIAELFGVEPKCIKARREEIEYELDLMAPEGLSSDVELEKQAPLSLDELDQVLEGYSDCNDRRA